LHAYNAEDVSELWNSDMTPSNVVGAWVKFVNPTVANGKVYVPTGGNQLLVYGVNATDGSDTSPVITGIVNAASYADGPIAPGEIVAVFGLNLGPEDLAIGTFSQSGIMNSQLAATQVTFNGIPGPLLYTSGGAIAAIVPYEVSGAGQVTVQVTYNGQVSPIHNVPAATAVPGVFSADASGSGPGAILNSDYSLNSPDNPASSGDIVVVYATGGGQTNPPAATGAITGEATSLAAETSVTVGGQLATVLYAGNAGGEVAGAIQLNLRLPAGVTGTVPVVVTIDGHSSQATTTVSVQGP
jgi:uncharacterized protein (TIGR03437 family)